MGIHSPTCSAKRNYSDAIFSSRLLRQLLNEPKMSLNAITALVVSFW